MTLMWFDSFRELDLPGVGPDDIDLALERNVLASSDRSSDAPDVVARSVPACPGGRSRGDRAGPVSSGSES